MDLSWDTAWIAHAAGLGVATTAGLVVGMERERSAADRDRHHIAGVRTTALIGLLGGVGGVLGQVLGVWVPLLLLAAMAAVVIAGTRRLPDAAEYPGVTTQVAVLVVASLGMLATTDLPGMSPPQRFGLVGAAALVVMSLLTLRQPLHDMAKNLHQDELIEVAKLGLLLLVALPLLPNHDVGPIANINPYEITLLVGLIAGISLSGYVAVRVFGAGRGMAIAGLLGGLASSTATTLGLSSQAKAAPDLATAAGRGIVLACLVMLPRQLLEVSVVAPELLPKAAVPLGAMAGTGALAAGLSFFFFKGSARQAGDGVPDRHSDQLRNPGSMTEALKFGLLFVVILVAADQLRSWLGTGGLYASAVLAGLTDVDAITLTISGMAADDDLALDVATRSLVLAAVSNTLVKTGIAAVVGGRRVGLAALAGLGPVVVVGLAVAFLT